MVDYTDINYDAASSSVSIAAYQAQAPHEDGWTETLNIEKGKVEVGILAAQAPLEPEETRMGGFMAVVGEDRKLSTYLQPLTQSDCVANQ